MKLTLAASFAAAMLLSGNSPAAAQTGLGASFPIACGSGYHPDAGGNCQPDNAQTNRYCARGWAFQPDFYGWRCVPPPREAY